MNSHHIIPKTLQSKPQLLGNLTSTRRAQKIVNPPQSFLNSKLAGFTGFVRPLTTNHNSLMNMGILKLGGFHLHVEFFTLHLQCLLSIKRCRLLYQRRRQYCTVKTTTIICQAHLQVAWQIVG